MYMITKDYHNTGKKDQQTVLGATEGISRQPARDLPPPLPNDNYMNPQAEQLISSPREGPRKTGQTP